MLYWLKGKFKMRNLILLLLLVSCANIVPKTSTTTTTINPPISPSSRYINSTSYAWLDEAVRVADCVTDNSAFVAEVYDIPSFYYTSDLGKDVAKNLVKKDSIHIYTYKSKNPFSKVNAYRGSNGSVYFNLRNNPRDLKDMVNTVIHERLHIWYSHNGNYRTTQNLLSVPYKVGDISEKYVMQCAESVKLK